MKQVRKAGEVNNKLGQTNSHTLLSFPHRCSPIPAPILPQCTHHATFQTASRCTGLLRAPLRPQQGGGATVGQWTATTGNGCALNTGHDTANRITTEPSPALHAVPLFVLRLPLSSQAVLTSPKEALEQPCAYLGF